MVIHLKKRGQVTIFIILAILLVIIALAIFYFIPKLQSSSELDTKNPNTYFQSCMESELEDTLTTIGLQGGRMNPEFYKEYQDEKIEYLCYTENKEEACDILRPFLEEHVVAEIKEELTPLAQSCYNELVTIYQAKSYTVIQSSQPGELIVELLPGKVKLSLVKDLTLTKSDTQKYSSFSVISNNNLYELLSVASNMVIWLSYTGKIEPTYYLMNDPNLKIEPNNPAFSDGSQVWTLTDKKYETKFQFAVRSWVRSLTF
jgi:uncharacterized protein (UPF0333 family)